MSDNIDNFAKAFTYTTTFQDATGNRTVECDNVCLVSHGYKPEEIFTSWLHAVNVRYQYGKVITVQEALELPTGKNHLSLKGKVELIGDTAQYITHTTAIRDL